MVTIKKCYKKRALQSIFIFCISIFILSVAVPAQADETWDHTWNSMHTMWWDYSTETSGWVTLNMTNNSGFAWGDLNVEIWECSAPFVCNSVENVHFLEGIHDSMQTPQTDRSPFTYNIDNDSVGATLDYYYYNDPIATGGDTGMFKFKIDNPDGTIYTLAVTPSVVPEPISSTLFVIGGATLGFRRFRKKRKTA